MSIKYENVCTKKVYTSNGVEKAQWFIVGTLKTLDDGKRFLELNIFPNTPFYIFEQKKKDEASGGGQEVPF